MTPPSPPHGPARLARTGRSRRAIGAHLAAKGVPAETARAALPDDPEAELDAALAYARRRRIGPFRAAEADADAWRREAAALARAGFARSGTARVADGDGRGRGADRGTT